GRNVRGSVDARSRRRPRRLLRADRQGATVRDYATDMIGSLTRAQRADIANAFLTEFLEAKFENGDSIAEYVLLAKPTLAKRLEKALARDTRRSMTVRFDFNKTDDDLDFTGMTLVSSQTSLSETDRDEI